MTHSNADRERENGGLFNATRVLIVGLVAVIIVLGLALVVMAIGRAPTATEAMRVDALAGSDDECVECHRRTTPGIVEQFGHSTMAAAEVVCSDCHEVAADYPGAVEHEGTWVLASPTTAMCEDCHTAEVRQFNMSRHAIPAYVAYAGLEALSDEHRQLYQSITEAEPPPNPERNALFALEGEEVTRFACQACHDVGKPTADGAVGDCSKCHLRHEFSLEQVRKPETCNFCHIGPDHPQYEIYWESPHGIAYATGGETWNWEADPGTLTVDDFPAPTCATCHMSSFGTQATTHDVGDRLSWYLFPPISEPRPGFADNRARMQGVCTQCHSESFITDYYANGDLAVAQANDWIRESQAIVAPLQEAGLMTDAPFDQPIDFTLFETWHHWGRTAKFGVWMQGPDYTQWHGAYEVLHALAELRQMTAETLEAAGIETQAADTQTEAAGQ